MSQKIHPSPNPKNTIQLPPYSSIKRTQSSHSTKSCIDYKLTFKIRLSNLSLPQGIKSGYLVLHNRYRALRGPMIAPKDIDAVGGKQIIYRFKFGESYVKRNGVGVELVVGSGFESVGKAVFETDDWRTQLKNHLLNQNGQKVGNVELCFQTAELKSQYSSTNSNSNNFSSKNTLSQINQKKQLKALILPTEGETAKQMYYFKAEQKQYLQHTFQPIPLPKACIAETSNRGKSGNIENFTRSTTQRNSAKKWEIKSETSEEDGVNFVTDVVHVISE